MATAHCKIAVKEVLAKLGLHNNRVENGNAEVLEPISPLERALIKKSLLAFGMEVLDNNKSILVHKIRGIIINMVHYTDERIEITFSDYLSQQLHYDYTYLANIFSAMEGITIEKFIIAEKIERVKQMLAYDEFNLTEIAYQLHYSSVAHLSSQFKKVTGQTPSYFKQQCYKQIDIVSGYNLA